MPGEVLVRFRADVSPAARGAALAAHGARRMQDLAVPGLVLAGLESGRDVPAAVAAFERRADVLYAEPNWIYRPTAVPNDPRFTSGELWGLHQSSDVDIDAPEAWDVTTGSSNVVVAVVDTGVAYDHPDLAANIWANPGEVVNGIDDDGNGRIDDVRGWDFIGNDNDPRDINGHGTHVAGTIGAKGNNATGIVGVNWNVQLMPVRVLGPQGGTSAGVTAGFAYAAQEGASVVNASLGCTECFSQSMKAAIDAATNTLFVVAAGNDGWNNELSGQRSYPCNYTSANLICVAATTRTDALASFSNFGATSVDVGAPGTEILSTWLAPFQTVFGDGFEADGVWTAGGTPNTWARTSESAVVGTFSGTDSPGANYADNTDNWFRTTNAINLGGRSGCHVLYAMQLATEGGFDWFVVDGSADGSTWTEVGAWTGSTTGSWFVFQEDFSSFDGSGTFFLRFGLESNFSINFDGAHVDDVAVRCVGTSYSASDYLAIQGTSMATPHVAGVAALAWAKNPAATVAQVRTAILNGGDSIAALSTTTTTGKRLNAAGTLALIAPPADATLTVNRTGTGTGTVTSSPAGIDCGVDCTETYTGGSMVTLTAAAAAGSHHAGWTGCDSVNGLTCTVGMSANRTVSATFTLGTFVDVPASHQFFSQIEEMFERGITTGCFFNPTTGERRYCPLNQVTRQEMAVFIVRAAGLPLLTPATPSFSDVPTTHQFYGQIERFFAEGITTGCQPPPDRRFCPLDNVTREAMAAFIIRAKELSLLTPATPTFSDVPTTHPFYGHIERFFEQGITTGCQPPPDRRFCPLDNVTREAMAAFIIRAYPGP